MKLTSAIYLIIIALMLSAWSCSLHRENNVNRHATDRDTAVSETGFKPYQYDNGDDYVSDGLYRIVDKDGLIGYATEYGKVAIAPRFAFGFPFDNGRAKVTDTGHLEEVEGSGGEYHYWKSDNWYWIDKTGNRIASDKDTH